MGGLGRGGGGSGQKVRLDPNPLRALRLAVHYSVTHFNGLNVLVLREQNSVF